MRITSYVVHSVSLFAKASRSIWNPASAEHTEFCTAYDSSLASRPTMRRMFTNCRHAARASSSDLAPMHTAWRLLNTAHTTHGSSARIARERCLLRQVVFGSTNRLNNKNRC